MVCAFGQSQQETEIAGSVRSGHILSLGTVVEKHYLGVFHSLAGYCNRKLIGYQSVGRLGDNGRRRRGQGHIEGILDRGGVAQGIVSRDGQGIGSVIHRDNVQIAGIRPTEIRTDQAAV